VSESEVNEKETFQGGVEQNSIQTHFPASNDVA
jgi:hypothetical protein